MPGRRLQSLRHRISDGGREWRAVHDKRLRRLLQPEARREEGAKGEWQAVVQQEDFLLKAEQEQVKNWDSHQPHTLHSTFPHRDATQHDLAHRHRLAVHHEKILVRCACEVSLLIHRACCDVHLIVV